MLVSKKLLDQFDNSFKKISEQAFVNVCNKIGIEVEQILKHEPIKGLEIVHIQDVVNHPNSNKLNLVTIKRKNNQVSQIVCGAANVTKDKYAIFAPVGTKLLNDLVISEREIRGVVSKGMLCGYSEITTLGVDMMSEKDSQGIILLDNANLTDDVSKHLWTDDVIYDLSIPSNRNDLNSLQVLANEILFGLNKDNNIDFSNITKYSHKQNIRNHDESLCTDIGFIKIDNIQNYEATWDQKQILMACGYKIQNNILDLMNLFTIKYGNPIHVYDATDLDLNSLHIEKIKNDTKVLGLDNNHYQVPKNAIGIYHNNELINIAGIIGLDKYKLNPEAKSIIIEVANFNPDVIRKTAAKMKIATKSQALFSKPLASWITLNCFDQIIEYLMTKNIKPKIAYSFSVIQKTVIAYDKELMYSFLGIKNPISFNNLLQPNLFTVPPYRLDLKDQFDVFEEVLKTLDINQLEEEPICYELNELQTEQNIDINKLKDFLITNGFLETKTYNLTNQEAATKFNFFDIDNQIKVKNPISNEREYLRNSMIDQLLKVIKFNLSRKRELFNIFEIQNIQTDYENTMSNLSLVIIQDFFNNKITQASVTKTFNSIKSLIKSLFKSIALDITFALNKFSIDEVVNKGLAILVNNKKIGYIALVKQSVAKEYDIEKEVFVISINLSKIKNTNDQLLLKPVSQFPIVKRDVNVTNISVAHLNQLISKIKNIAGIFDCVIKDIYQGDKVTYTLSLDIRSNDKTLNTNEIDQIISKVNNLINYPKN